MNETLHTKFGTAKLYNGYYHITSKRECNHNKLLHRLIWEDFYNCSVPEGCIIHHKNGIKTDNCILNLQLMRKADHNSLHMNGEKNPMYGRTGENNPRYGKHHSYKSKNQIGISNSKKQNTSGYFRVIKVFYYSYRYNENGKRKQITSGDIKKLEEKVKALGLPWYKLDEGVE